MMKVIIAQKGPREHFLAARALCCRGLLALLIVDWYAPMNPLMRWACKVVSPWIGDRGRAALAARAIGLPDRLVRTNRINGLVVKWKQRINPYGGSHYERALRADVEFTKNVANLALPAHDVFFGFSYMSLEVMEASEGRDVLTILDQIDPGPAEFLLVADEMENRPELAGEPLPFPTAYYARLRREWDLADVIIVNSEWSRKALVSEGVNPSKLEILPLAFEAAPESLEIQASSSDQKPRPLKVLWLGQVNVRKGIHYLIEAARILEGEDIHFDVVGPVSILPEVVTASPKNMTFHGSVSRDHTAAWYAQSDLFVLPTLSDGFALTQLEAMAHGLPVVATPNCGRVVEEGITGYVVPPYDTNALVKALLKFCEDSTLATSMKPACQRAVKRFSLDAYGDQLEKIIRKHSMKEKRESHAHHGEE